MSTLLLNDHMIVSHAQVLILLEVTTIVCSHLCETQRKRKLCCSHVGRPGGKGRVANMSIDGTFLEHKALVLVILMELVHNRKD